MDVVREFKNIYMYTHKMSTCTVAQSSYETKSYSFLFLSLSLCALLALM
jgi:hypothetical protein